MTVYTIGHSTREIAEFIEILKRYDIRLLVDVRTVPRSRHTPQFNGDSLEGELKKHGIDYTHVAKLGGLRHAAKDSVNTGWRNTSFRGYADYMQTTGFKEGIGELLELANSTTAAIMCAEAVPWRCHRSLIGDALLVRNAEVVDIFDKNKTQKEQLTSFARVDGADITYPPEAST